MEGVFLYPDSFTEEKEQKAAATILSAADAVIEVLEKKLAALERQKRGLMRLLTGEVRAKV